MLKKYLHFFSLIIFGTFVILTSSCTSFPTNSVNNPAKTASPTKFIAGFFFTKKGLILIKKNGDAVFPGRLAKKGTKDDRLIILTKKKGQKKTKNGDKLTLPIRGGTKIEGTQIFSTKLTFIQVNPCYVRIDNGILPPFLYLVSEGDCPRGM